MIPKTYEMRREDQEDVMCASFPEGLTAAAVMVTSMAVLTTSMTCNVAQGCLGTICLDIIHFTHTHTHSDMPANMYKMYP